MGNKKKILTIYSICLLHDFLCIFTTLCKICSFIDIKKLDYESNDFSIPLFEKIVAYICEAYQLERCIIRNRRKEEDSNIRKLKEIPYEMDCDFNNTEFRIYGLLSEWIYSLETNETDFNDKLMPLITAFFSSSMAFGSALKNSVLQVPDEIKELYIW